MTVPRLLRITTRTNPPTYRHRHVRRPTHVRATTMALLLRGCVAPVGLGHAAAFRRAEPLPCRRSSSSRLVAVASVASSTASSSDGAAETTAAALDARGDSYDGRLGGTNGAVTVTPKSTVIETTIERVIFDFRFLALLAVAGSLAGSLLCFLNGCVYIKEAFRVYWTGCLRGVHSGQMVLKVVEAIDVYLAGTVMLIFGMGLYGLFISNASTDAPSESDRALKGSSLFGMFALKERPKWMKITSLDELKTKVGHVIVMILLVKMFERSKTVAITSGMDLLSYSACIFLSSASLYILHNLHKENHHDDEDDVVPHL